MAASSKNVGLDSESRDQSCGPRAPDLSAAWRQLKRLQTHCYKSSTRRRICSKRLQDPLYRPNYYQSLLDFREQTYQRLVLFSAQKFFKTEDYLKSTLLRLLHPEPAVQHRSASLWQWHAAFCARVYMLAPAST